MSNTEEIPGLSSDASDPFKVEAKNQLVQNLVFFSGLIFAIKLFNPGLLILVILGYLALSYVSIFTRIINFHIVGGVVLDRSRWVEGFVGSSLHRAGLAIYLILLTISLILNFKFGFTLLVVALLGLAYDTFFRSKVIFDVMVLSIEFIFKAAAGAVILNVDVSPWLIICAFLIALMIALGQRRNEYIAQRESANRRPILKRYTPQLLDQMIGVAAGSTLIAYSLYTISARTVEHLATTHLVYTIPLVVYGVLRYLYLVYTKDISEGMEKTLLRDKPILLCGLLWMIFVIVMIYIAHD